jgi:predicted RNase H-like HicB family nuclease
VILDRQPDGGFHASCPALKGCHSQGDSLEETIGNMREAIEAYLESIEAHGDAIPRDEFLIARLRSPYDQAAERFGP